MHVICVNIFAIILPRNILAALETLSRHQIVDNIFKPSVE